MNKTSSDRVEVFYTPSRNELRQAELDPDSGLEHQVKLLEIDSKNQYITIFPIRTLGRSGFLQPKYNKIRRITLANRALVVFPGDVENPSESNGQGFLSPYSGATVPFDEDLIDIESLELVPSTEEDVMRVLEGLPSTFIKDYDWGLGLTKKYRFIVDAVEKLSDCTEIVISNVHETGIDHQGKLFHISAKDFETARKEIDNITNTSRTAAQSVKNGKIHNLLAEKIGEPKVPVTVGRSPLRKLFTAVAQGQEPLSDDEQAVVVREFEKNVTAIAETEPDRLAKLQHDIELVTLETLIARYEEMITKKLSEKRWQDFLNENPFILSLACGYPIIKVKDQAYVGGRKISGSGDRITDFLVKNSLTNNTAIIEIKTPQEKLLKVENRKGVHTPSTELSGSIMQALDQKYRFEREIAQFKENSRIYDIETYCVHCCVIIGKVPSADDQQKSFEHFRRNSKNVDVITFDELMEKLSQLREFLSSDHAETPTRYPVAERDLPF
ncbi:MAG: DUF4263 domain-containing protein [Gemmatimonadota bacterium]|nr:DUF4263 domain-containing protein [Gemmatimonadota bacterium]